LAGQLAKAQAQREQMEAIEREAKAGLKHAAAIAKGMLQGSEGGSKVSSPGGKEWASEDARLAFSKMDVDGDGVITADEFEAAFTAHLNPYPHQRAAALQRMQELQLMGRVAGESPTAAYRTTARAAPRSPSPSGSRRSDSRVSGSPYRSAVGRDKDSADRVWTSGDPGGRLRETSGSKAWGSPSRSRGEVSPTVAAARASRKSAGIDGESPYASPVGLRQPQARSNLGSRQKSDIDREAREIFDRMDRNGDGVVDREEFLAAYASRQW